MITEQLFQSLLRRARMLPSGSPNGELARLLGILELTRDSSLADLVSLKIAELEAQMLESPFPVPDMSSSLNSGNHEILLTENKIPVCVSFGDEQNSITHISCFGQSKSGKSCLMALIAGQCAGSEASLIIDTNKFYSKIKDLHDKYIYVNWQDLRLNPFDEILGIDSAQIDQTVVHELVENYSLQFGEYLILEVLNELRETQIPNWFLILEKLREKRYPGFSNKNRYRDSALLVIESMLSATKNLFNCAKGIALSEILKNNIVLELDGLLYKHQSYVIRFLFSYLYLVSLA